MYDVIDPIKKGFVITMSYGHFDQHTVATCAIFTQICWLKTFNLEQKVVIVEPFASRSHFENIPQHWTAVELKGNDRVLRLSDYFDIDYLNSVLVKEKSPKLVEWELFLSQAPRDVVAVTIEDLNGENDKCFGRIGKPNMACRFGPRNQAQIDYFTSGCDTSEVDEAMKYLQRHGFRLKRKVCLNCRHGLPTTGYSPDDITRHITKSINLKNVTILFNVWTYATNLARNCELYRYCSDCVDFHNNEYKKLLPSNRLTMDAKRYLNDVLHATSISVAILIRTERMIKTLKDVDKVLQCLDSIVHNYTGIVSELKIDVKTSKPLVTTDIGKFGTSTFAKFCPECAKSTEQVVAKFEHLLSNLYSEEWTFEHYENGLLLASGYVKESGYIAGLQRVLASQARCLMLYGSGHFQALAEHYYKLRHPDQNDQCIYRMYKCGYKY